MSVITAFRRPNWNAEFEHRLPSATVSHDTKNGIKEMREREGGREGREDRQRKGRKRVSKEGKENDHTRFPGLTSRRRASKFP